MYSTLNRQKLRYPNWRIDRCTLYRQEYRYSNRGTYSCTDRNRVTELPNRCTDMNRADVTKQFYVLTGTELPIQVYRPKQSYLNRCTDRNRVT